MAIKVERNFKVLGEVISPENVQVMAELLALKETKRLIRFMGSLAIQVHNRLYGDVVNKDVEGYVLSGSYDLVQTVAVFLCEYFGERLDDLLYVSKKGKAISIKLKCYRLIERQICAKCRRRKRSMSLEALSRSTEPRTEMSFEKPDYTGVDEIIENLNLTENNEIILNCRMSGMSYPKIGRIVNRAISTVWHSIDVMRKRYLEITQ